MRHFRAFLGPFFSFSWPLGLLLILLFGSVRFLFVLQAGSGGNYRNTSLLFLFMWLTPFLFLNKSGRKVIGFKKPSSIKWWLYSLALGILMCSLVFLLGLWLYGEGSSNWFAYISRSYTASIPVNIEEHRLLLFTMFALIGVSFSPIGEEFLYRGIIHQCFVPALGENRASIVDSLAFGLTHLAHFGILYIDGHWEFRALPALFWVLLMFLSSRLFFYCKKMGGSLYLSVVCHAGFNLAMTYFIFYHLL